MRVSFAFLFTLLSIVNAARLRPSKVVDETRALQAVDKKNTGGGGNVDKKNPGGTDPGNPSPTPPNINDNCKYWCASDSNPWTEKCSWTNTCAKCPECGSSSDTCKDWCATSTKWSWTEKCTWTKTCAGCSACSGSGTGLVGNCKDWCSSSEWSWNEKCTWNKNCGGCAQCQ